MTTPAIRAAVDFLVERGHPVPVDIAAAAYAPTFKAALFGYESARANLWARVYDAVYRYLTGGSIVPTRNDMKKAVADVYNTVADIAYQDGGGTLPMDEDTQAYVASEQGAQLAYVDGLFQRLKELRKEDPDLIHEPFATADRWASALDGFYNAVKLAGARGQLLVWRLGFTERHCKDCAWLDGQRHRASWYRSRGYYPKKPGSATECGGYRCDCSLIDKNGNEFSI